jgi:hypothetical protein
MDGWLITAPYYCICVIIRNVGGIIGSNKFLIWREISAYLVPLLRLDLLYIMSLSINVKIVLHS